MIASLPIMHIAVSLMSLISPQPVAIPINYSLPLNYVVQEGKKLSQPEMDLLLRKLETSFVRLVSDDGKVNQGWGLLYDFGFDGIKGLLVRSLDVYRFGKQFVELSAITMNKSMVVMNPDNWKSEQQSRQSVTINNENDFHIPDEGNVSGLLVYPARDGKIHTAKVGITLATPVPGKVLGGLYSYNPPEDCDSGVGIIVRSDGKLLPFATEAGDKTNSLSFDFDSYYPRKLSLSDLRGPTKFVDPLSNKTAVYILASAKDELDQVAETEVKSYVSAFLNEECPRLLVSPSINIPNKKTSIEYEPKTTVERNAISQLFSGYSQTNLLTLSIEYQRGAGGLFIVELTLGESVIGNGGATSAILYKDYICGVNREKTAIVRDHIKTLVKRFADKWIVANPREKD